MSNKFGNRIQAAAIKNAVTGKVYSVPIPGRHHHVIQEIYEITGKSVGQEYVQGFISDTGEFLDRKKALVVALAANQILKKTNPPYELFSEDMW